MKGYSLLKWTFGLLPIIVGFDKFTNFLAQWHSYLAPQVAEFIPFSPQSAMYMAGVGEVVLGLAILTKWTRAGAYLEAIWLFTIVVNLVLFGAYDVALRDLVLAFGALSLGLLSSGRW